MVASVTIVRVRLLSCGVRNSSALAKGLFMAWLYRIAAPMLNRERLMNITRLICIVSVASIFLVAGCGGGGASAGANDEPPANATSLDGVLVKFGGESATRKLAGRVPPPSNVSNQPQVAIGRTSVTGFNGSAVKIPLMLNAGDLLSTLYAKVSGVDGVFQLDLSSVSAARYLATNEQNNINTKSDAQFAVDLELGFQPTTSAGRVPIEVVVVDKSGRVSMPDVGEINIERASTGDLQFALSWNELADLDLHVIEPNGTEIYFANPSSSSGGSLDLDDFDGGADSIENIFWSQSPPAGSYDIEVNHFSGEPANFVATVSRDGQIVDTFSANNFGSEKDCVRVARGRLGDNSDFNLKRFPIPVGVCRSSGSTPDLAQPDNANDPAVVASRLQGAWEACVLGQSSILDFQGDSFVATNSYFEFSDCSGRMVRPVEVIEFGFSVGDSVQAPEGFVVNNFDTTVIGSNVGFPVGSEFYGVIYSDELQITTSSRFPDPSGRQDAIDNMTFEFTYYRSGTGDSG